MKKAFIAAVFSLVTAQLWAGDMGDLDLQHWAYPVLQRFEAKGYLRLPVTRPYHYLQVASLLEAMSARMDSGKIALSGSDRYNWERLGQEFLQQVDGPRLVEKELVSLGDDNVNFKGDAAVIPQSNFSNLSSPSHSLTGQVDFWGSLKQAFIYDQRLSFLVEKEKTKVERTSATQNTWRGGKFIVDWSYFRAKASWLYITLGRQQHWWGPGRVGTLLLSDNAPAFDALNLKLDYKRVGFESFAGILGTEQQRFFSGHRGTLVLPWNIDLGASEVVIYQARNIDPVYVNPLLPFYGTQWNERDDDNVLWSADVTWRPYPGYTVYGELLMDDVQYEQDPPAPQKLGFIGGLHWADPAGLPDTDVKLEYAGNQKWVYGHRRYVNRYVGSDTVSVIGHFIGTDADLFGLKIEHRFHPRFDLGLQYSLERHGEGRISNGLAYGDTIFYAGGEPYTTGGDLGSDTVMVGTAFLTGVIQRRDMAALYFTWQPWHWSTINAKFWMAYTRNLGNLEGLGLNDRGAEVSVRLDY
jgi:hypothetical protein